MRDVLLRVNEVFHPSREGICSMSAIGRGPVRRAVLFSVLLLAGPCVTLGEPFVLKDDAQVLERLPYTPGDPQVSELREQRNTLASDPYNVALAVETAREYISKGRAKGDPRFFGYAQAALEL